jgi:hypothetical protein
MSFLSLVIHNVGAHKVRSALTALAVAVGVMTVVTLGLVNHSMRSSAFALMQTGRADFTVAQKGVSDILNSSIDAYDLTQIQQRAGVADAVGVLISTTRLNPSNPLFLQIGVPRSDLANFGVTVVEGRAYGGGAPGEMLLGWRARRRHIGRRWPQRADRRPVPHRPGARRHRRHVPTVGAAELEAAGR